MLFITASVANVPFANAQGFLEIPQPNSYQSGIGIVSGWYCDAGQITFSIDGGREIPAAYGTERTDTEAVCGDRNNGFVFLINYNGQGNGPHQITVFADGIPFGSSSYQVSTPGDEFISGVSRTIEVSNFPVQGGSATLIWQEANQNFVITGFKATLGYNNLSGIWLLKAFSENAPGCGGYGEFSMTQQGIFLAGSGFLESNCDGTTSSAQLTGTVDGDDVAILFTIDDPGEPQPVQVRLTGEIADATLSKIEGDFSFEYPLYGRGSAQLTRQ